MAVEPRRLQRGMVVLVRLPGDKARPAVVLRSDALARLPYATEVAFTTTVHAEPDLRLRVGPTPENGLQQWSFVMVDWPQTIRTEHMGDNWPSRSGHAGGDHGPRGRCPRHR